MLRRSFSKLLALGVALGAGLGVGAIASAHGYDADVVYTMSNDAGGNTILSFTRNANGSLTPGAVTATGGLGTSAGLGNQGGLVSDGEFILAVNAGSNDVSVLKVGKHGLRVVDVMPSGGVLPVSIAIDGNLVYVLNAGSDNIAGFWLSNSGRLYSLPGSVQGLSGTGTGAAQIGFGAHGRSLIVTEKATNKIDSFPLNRWGIPTGMSVIDAATPTPFGFATAHRNVVVSEAVGGAPGASTLSSYRIGRTGELSVVSPSVATTQTAACWVVITPNGRHVYTTNTGSNSISSYRLKPSGELTLQAAVAAHTDGGPIDMALSDDGDTLYVLNSGGHSINAFGVEHDGSLTPLGAVAGLPATADGLVAF